MGEGETSRLLGNGNTLDAVAQTWHAKHMMRVLLHVFLVLLLTIVTQLGGIAWLLALTVKRRLLAFALAYAALSVGAIFVAPLFGRVAMSCFQDGPLQVQSWLYCAANRTYVTPELAEVLADAAAALETRHPGTITVMLDGSFPFLDGFPMLPHLSHDDGEKVDLAFFYRDGTGYLPRAVRSPIGYFAFEEGPTHCPEAWPTLRWDLAPLQPLWHDYALDEVRLAAMLEILGEDTRVGRIFVEPHLVERMGVANPSIGFQGCRAARHDDHIHFQL